MGLGVLLVAHEQHRCVSKSTPVFTTSLAAAEALAATRVVRARIAGSVASAVSQHAPQWGEGCMSSCELSENATRQAGSCCRPGRPFAAQVPVKLRLGRSLEISAGHESAPVP